MPDGSQVAIAGTVTVAPGRFVSALDAGFGLQDDSGGIWVSLDAKDRRPPLARGDRVRVSGRLGEVAKLRVLTASAAAVEQLSEGAGQDGTPRPIAAGAVNASSEGQIIRVTGQVTRTVIDDSPYGYKLFVSDGSGEVQIFCHASAGFDLAGLQSFGAGQRLQVTGLSLRYESTFEVGPREAAEIIKTN